MENTEYEALSISLESYCRYNSRSGYENLMKNIAQDFNKEDLRYLLRKTNDVFILKTFTHHYDKNFLEDIAYNTNTPDGILWQLAEREIHDVQRSVSFNPNASVETLEYLIRNALEPTVKRHCRMRIKDRKNRTSVEIEAIKNGDAFFTLDTTTYIVLPEPLLTFRRKINDDNIAGKSYQVKPDKTYFIKTGETIYIGRILLDSSVNEKWVFPIAEIESSPSEEQFRIKTLLTKSFNLDEIV